MAELREVDITSIEIPSLRVTSQFDAELLRELGESIAKQGILQPPQVAEVEGKLWLIDGLHRIQAAKNLGWTRVHGLVQPSTAREVIGQNLVVNRQRGKSNPAEEAKLIRTLREAEGLPLAQIAAMPGLSVGWTRRLHDISYLNPSVLEMVGASRLGVTHAMELLRLEDEALQLEVATQALEWRYTVEQVRLRVDVLLRPQVAPPPGGTSFGETGAPYRVPIPCCYCQRDLTGNISYRYMCGDCQTRHDAMEMAYDEAIRAPLDGEAVDAAGSPTPATEVAE